MIEKIIIPTVMFIIAIAILLIIIYLFKKIKDLDSKIPEKIPDWPYIFDIENISDEDQYFNIIINDTINQNKKYKIFANQKLSTKIGEMKTSDGKTLNRENILTVSFKTIKDGILKYSSPNVKIVPQFSEILGKNSSTVTKTSSSAEIQVYNEMILDKAGYYTIKF